MVLQSRAGIFITKWGNIYYKKKQLIQSRIVLKLKELKERKNRTSTTGVLACL